MGVSTHSAETMVFVAVSVARVEDAEELPSVTLKRTTRPTYTCASLLIVMSGPSTRYVALSRTNYTLQIAVRSSPTFAAQIRPRYALAHLPTRTFRRQRGSPTSQLVPRTLSRELLPHTRGERPISWGLKPFWTGH